MSSGGITGSCGSFIPRFFFKEYSYSSSQWLYQFAFSLTMQESSLFSTPAPALTVCRLFDDGHSDWCEVISHCGFDLHFPED